MLPPRIPKVTNKHAAKKAKRSRRIRCEPHLRWVRDHQCCVPLCSLMPIEAAHVRRGTHTGIGMKPDDSMVISLCTRHHGEQHTLGELAFEMKYHIDMWGLAQEFAAKSPYRARLKQMVAA